MTSNKKKKKMGREKAAITNGWRRSMLRIAELNTWRSARKQADPEPSRGDVATVRRRVIAAFGAVKPERDTSVL